MMGYDSRIYQADAELGFIFPQEQLVGTKKFVGLNSILHSIKKDNKVVLNLGDSSTSGWNSNQVYQGVKNPYAALFTYKTYSQILEEKYKVKAINAGVPGYSSLQGSKCLKRLLRNIFTKPTDEDKLRLEFMLGLDKLFDKQSLIFKKHLAKLILGSSSRISHPNGIIKIRKLAI